MYKRARPFREAIVIETERVLEILRGLVKTALTPENYNPSNDTWTCTKPSGLVVEFILVDQVLAEVNKEDPADWRLKVVSRFLGDDVNIIALGYTCDSLPESDSLTRPKSWHSVQKLRDEYAAAVAAKEAARMDALLDKLRPLFMASLTDDKYDEKNDEWQVPLVDGVERDDFLACMKHYLKELNSAEPAPPSKLGTLWGYPYPKRNVLTVWFDWLKQLKE